MAALLLPDNPYDEHTLKESILSVEANSGIVIKDGYVDKGIADMITPAARRFTLPGNRIKDAVAPSEYAEDDGVPSNG